MGRIAGIVVVVGGILFAFWVPNVVKALEVWFMIAPMMGIAFWLGLFWRRLSVAGAWASTLAGFATWFLTTRPGVIAYVADIPLSNAWRMIWMEGEKQVIYLPWQIVAYLTAGTAVGIVVSLFTRPVPKEQLNRFYTLTRTPVRPGEQLEKPCRLPKDVKPVECAMLLTAGGLEIPAPSRTSVVGFILGWLAVAAIIAGFMLLWS